MLAVIVLAALTYMAPYAVLSGGALVLAGGAAIFAVGAAIIGITGRLGEKEGD